MGNPSDIATRRRRQFERPRASAFVLSVVEGPDAGLRVRIDAAQCARVLVGQSPACAMRLTDREVSRRHAAVALGGPGLVVIDLGSTNGTHVNGVLIKEAFLTGVEALRLGASVVTVAREDDRPAPLGSMVSFGRLVGESRSMRRLFPLLERLARTDDPVLIEGEAGTGKALVAEELHGLGPRAAQPLVVLDADTPVDQAEERLFTLLAEGRGGTLYIDEIGDLPASAQARLAKRLDDPALRAEVRLVAATRRDLDRDITEGRFHDPLFYLLTPGRIELPPLRDREGDLQLLAEREWRALRASDSSAPAELPADFLVRYEGYAWPGNVRELRAAVVSRFARGELATVYRRGDRSESSLDLLTTVIERDLPFTHAKALIVGEFERRYVQRVLDQHGGNVRRAAEASGIAHRYFQLVRSRSR